MNRKPQGPRAKRSSARATENAEGESKYSKRESNTTKPYLPAEESAYEAFAAEQLRRYDPHTPAEHDLVFTIIDTTWRLHRIPSLEARLSIEPVSAKLTRSLQILVRHENRLIKILKGAKKALEALVAQRDHPHHPQEILDDGSLGFVLQKNRRDLEDLLKLPPVTNAWLV